MWARTRLSLGIALLLMGATRRTAAAETIVGVVTELFQDSVQVRPNRGGAPREVTLDGDTKYMRWITHQPWQQSTVADRSFVKTGRCISVEPRGDAHVAKLVRISADEVGTIYSPCRPPREAPPGPSPGPKGDGNDDRATH
jgi:hypothetical protein